MFTIIFNFYGKLFLCEQISALTAVIKKENFFVVKNELQFFYGFYCFCRRTKSIDDLLKSNVKTKLVLLIEREQDQNSA